MERQGLVSLRTRGDALQRRVPRIVRFLVVGGVSVVLDVGLLVGLRELVRVSIPVATTTAFWVALCVNFWLHKVWSFSDAGPAGAPFAKYMTLVAVNYLITLGIVTGGVAVGVPYVAAKLVAIAVGVAWTYVAYGRWVFA